MQTTPHTVDVFTAGADGIHTYRIPALIALPGGPLLAFCEARKFETKDASPTDLVMKRSHNDGDDWAPLQTVVRGVDREAIMNPCVMADGRDIILFCVNTNKTGHGRHRLLMLRGQDDGAAWLPPVDITDAVVNRDDTFIPGPGLAVKLRNGRWIVPGTTKTYDAAGTRIAGHARVLFSDDQGRTWRLGAPVEHPLSGESQVVELNDGSLMINYRVNPREIDRAGCRGVAISKDGGATWENNHFAAELNEPACQAGLIGCPSPGAGRPGALLFSNPDTRTGPDGGGRTHLTIKLSFDQGRTWPVKNLIHAGPSAYSCPAILSGERVGLLYECGQAYRHEHIRFARIPMKALCHE